MTADVWSSNRAAVAPDVREDVARAEARMRAAGWRVKTISDPAPLRAGRLDVVRLPAVDLDMFADDVHSTLTLRSERLEIRRWAGTVRLTRTAGGALGVHDRIEEVCGPGAYIRDRRRACWTNTFTPTPVRVRDPGTARRALRIAGQRRSSKRVPISLLKRAAERYLNRPVHHRVDGVVFEVSVSLGHFAFDSVDRIVHAWPNRGCEGWAALAWEGWDGYTHVERDACLDAVLVEHRSERRWVTARDLAISGSAGAWQAGRPTHPGEDATRSPDGGP